MISADVQKLSPGPLVELYILDSTALGGDVLRFHNGVNELGNDVVFDGDTYTRFPVEATGFERSGTGAMPRPTLKVANITGLVGALTRELDGLVGAKLTRRRTFLQYLDAVNFEGGVNPSADPTAIFPDDVWFIDRKASEDATALAFELAAASDVEGVNLPRRQFTQNACPWKYRSAECGYAGGPVADKNDVPTSDADADQCGKRVTSCKLRFGATAELPYGAFPACGLIR
jgi:lambda family phage minor tail protein L